MSAEGGGPRVETASRPRESIRERRLAILKAAPRCGAKTRRETCCAAPAIKGRARCRNHGGRSTGPKTQAGIENIRQAQWKTGYHSAEAKAVRRELREFLRQARATLDEFDEAS